MGGGGIPKGTHLKPNRLSETSGCPEGELIHPFSSSRPRGIYAGIFPTLMYAVQLLHFMEITAPSLQACLPVKQRNEFQLELLFHQTLLFRPCICHYMWPSILSPPIRNI